MRDEDAARSTLASMPPRAEEELDGVTLHNTALLGMAGDPTGGFRKLNFLLASPAFPPETLGNLLMLYLQHGCHDLAAGVIADHAELTYRYLPPEAYEFLDASIMAQTSQEEAYRLFDALASKHTESMRQLSKAVQGARASKDGEGVRAALKAHAEALQAFVPVLMGQAKLFWDREAYGDAERLLRQAAEFAGEDDTWRLNLAHVYFMQGTKFTEAIRHYEPLVRRSWDSILDITAIVLANLCVAYIMTSHNEEAEAIMRRIEQEEARLAEEEPDRPVFHLCIVNLVIGTLYCSKGNFAFGVSRVVTSLRPLERKLGTDTWYYAKRCLLALVEGAAKHTVVVADATYGEALRFLDAVEAHGKSILTVLGRGGAPGGAEAYDGEGDADAGAVNVSTEARLLKRMFLTLRAAT